MAANPRIALIGGGIGGLAAAIALRQRGFEPVGFEQADRLKEVGAGIQITPNSTRILRALGLEDAVRKRGFEPGYMLTRDMVTGEVLFRTKDNGAAVEIVGRQREPFDVVVGCDGIRSLVRATLHGEQSVRFTGNMCWRA